MYTLNVTLFLNRVTALDNQHVDYRTVSSLLLSCVHASRMDHIAYRGVCRTDVIARELSDISIFSGNFFVFYSLSFAIVAQLHCYRKHHFHRLISAYRPDSYQVKFPRIRLQQSEVCIDVGGFVIIPEFTKIFRQFIDEYSCLVTVGEVYNATSSQCAVQGLSNGRLSVRLSVAVCLSR